MTRTKQVLKVLAATLLLGGSAAAQTVDDQQDQLPQDLLQGDQEQQGEPNEPVQVMAPKVSAVVTIAKLDAKNRELVVKDRQGRHFKVSVPETMKNFDAFKTGDKVAIEYYSSIALNLETVDDAAADTPGTAMTVERVPAPLPNGVVANKVDETVQVVSVDKAKHKLTIRRPAGKLDTIDVTEAELQSSLADLDKGDKVHATYAEAVAISIEPQKKTKAQARR